MGEAEGTPAGAEDVVYAGFWRRLAAHVLDHLIILVPLFGVQLALMFLLPVSGPDSGAVMIWVQLSFYFGYFLIAPFYFAGLESSAAQATPGKRALGIKVTNLAGERIGFGQALGRWFASALSYLSMYLGFIMAGFSDRKRALHDFLASTLVVDKWAYTAAPERQQRVMSVGLKAFIVLFLCSTLIVPLGFALAISEYQKFTQRAQVSEGATAAAEAKIAIAEYAQNNGRLPRSNAEAGLAGPAEMHGMYVSYIDIGKRPGRIEVGFSSQPPQRAHEALDGKRLWFDATIHGDAVDWKCHSSELEQMYCPSSCICSG